MKKIKALLLIITIVLSSCSKPDEKITKESSEFERLSINDELKYIEGESANEIFLKAVKLMFADYEFIDITDYDSNYKSCINRDEKYNLNNVVYYCFLEDVEISKYSYLGDYNQNILKFLVYEENFNYEFQFSNTTLINQYVPNNSNMRFDSKAHPICGTKTEFRCNSDSGTSYSNIINGSSHATANLEKNETFKLNTFCRTCETFSARAYQLSHYVYDSFLEIDIPDNLEYYSFIEQYYNEDIEDKYYIFPYSEYIYFIPN